MESFDFEKNLFGNWSSIHTSYTFNRFFSQSCDNYIFACDIQIKIDKIRIWLLGRNFFFLLLKKKKKNRTKRWVTHFNFYLLNCYWLFLITYFFYILIMRLSQNREIIWLSVSLNGVRVITIASTRWLPFDYKKKTNNYLLM